MIFMLDFQPLKENKFVINKSRYDSIDSYLSPCYRCNNDIDLVYDHDIYKELIEASKDSLFVWVLCLAGLYYTLYRVKLAPGDKFVFGIHSVLE